MRRLSLIFWRVAKNPAFWALLFSPTAIHWTAVEVLVFYRPTWADGIRSSVWYLLPVLFVIGLIVAWPKNKFKRKISGTDIDVSIKVGSIFSSKNPLVIGATTHFDFSLDDDPVNPSISPSSVQGQFQEKYFDRPSDIGPILERAKNRLVSIETNTLQEKPFGPRINFSRGEVIAVPADKRCAYFVTMATLNNNRKAELSLDEYFDLIPKMWDGVRQKGNLEPLDIPLLGARFGRTGLKLDQTITLLIRSFVAASREEKLVDDITFYVSVRDYLKGDFTPEQLEAILDRECNHEKIDTRALVGAAASSGGMVL
jgi:hypothetical protein